MKKITSLLLTLVFISTATAHASFTDVASDFHQQKAINWLQTQGVVKGYDNGDFQPEKPVNRAEFLKMLYETIGMENKEIFLPFKDVPQDEWYTKYVKEAYATGVIKGYKDGTFKPDGEINLAEALKIVMEALFDFETQFTAVAYSSECDEGETWSTLNLLSDDNIAKIDSDQWYWKYLKGAVATCVMSVGYNANGMGGLWMDGSVDRGDMAELLYRAKTVKDNNNTPYTKTIKPNPIFPNLE